MATLDRNRNGISYSMREPSLREQAPSSLRKAGPLRQEFIAANNRDDKRQKDLFSESGRSKGQDREGSQMVKRQKPYPELKPSYFHHVKKVSFDQEWMREQRDVKIQRLETQRKIQLQRKSLSEPILER